MRLFTKKEKLEIEYSMQTIQNTINLKSRKIDQKNEMENIGIPWKTFKQ